MNVRVIAIESPEDALACISSGPLARYAEAGTSGLVEDSVTSIIGPAFCAAAARARVPVEIDQRGDVQADGSMRVQVGRSSSSVEDDGVDAWLAAGNVLVLLVGSPAAQVTGWIIVGFALPSFGHLATVRRDDLWTTWLCLAGAMSGGGRNLLEEEAAPLDPHGDAQLTARLRQLYGE